MKEMSPSQPKARFYTRINEKDYLGVTVWPGKADPSAEVITLQLRRNEGDNWETIWAVSSLQVARRKLLKTS